jgi:FkbM family methyltransferase
MDIAILNLNLGDAQRPFHYRKGSSDEGVIAQVLKNSDYNFGRLRRGPELSELYRRLTGSGQVPLIVDAGANIGASAVYFHYSFPAARLVAIEPERGNFDLLSANTAGLPVECVQAALTSSAGTVGVTDPGQGHWGYRTMAASNTEKAVHSVASVTLNDIYANHANTVPFIAKIDIEGGESDLFAANTEWVDRTPIIIIELHDWLMPGLANSRAFLQCIAGRNRDFVYVGENIFSIDNALVPNLAAA